MTRRDTLACVHEPFGDAFYYGQERLSERFKNDEKTREESGYANSTFKTIFESLEREGFEVRPSPYAIISLYFQSIHGRSSTYISYILYFTFLVLIKTG